MEKARNRLKKILKSEIVEISITIILFAVFITSYCISNFKLSIFFELNNEMRSMVSIFTGMLGTMIGLIFASNMGRVLKNMNNKIGGLWPIKARVRSSFISALLFLSYSLVFEILTEISLRFLNPITISLLVGLFAYFMTSISHTVEIVIKSTFAGLEDNLKQEEAEKKYH